MRYALPAAALLCILGLSAVVATPLHGVARAQALAPSGNTVEGKRVYQRANCVGCHKWHGAGGGGYGGDALSLRATKLTRDQIAETIACGRPSTGMPYFRRGAYDGNEHPCYGLGRQDLGKDMPAEAPNGFLRPGEIAAVIDYVSADIKGKDEPTYADCASFFGDGARVCNVYKTERSAPASDQPEKGGS